MKRKGAPPHMGRALFAKIPDESPNQPTTVISVSPKNSLNDSGFSVKPKSSSRTVSDSEIEEE